MSIFNITAADLIPLVIEDITKPSFAGDYQLVFTAQHPFIADPQMILTVHIEPDGSPMIMYPDTTSSKEEFESQLQALMCEIDGSFRSHCGVTLIKRDEEGVALDNWTWKIEKNGHFLPHSQSGGDMDLKAGWTINHAAEVFIALFESMQLLETSVDKVAEAGQTQFVLTLMIDNLEEQVVATRSPDGSFTLDREDYPEAYLSFKNVAYLADALLTISVGDQIYAWSSVWGILVPIEHRGTVPGWEIEITEEEAEALYESLTIDAEQAESLKPDPMQVPATDDQQAFINELIPAEETDAQHLMHVLTTPPESDKPQWMSTRIDKVPTGYIVEIPALMDFVLNERNKDEQTVIILQTLLEFEEDKPVFDFHGWKLQDDNALTVLNDAEFSRYKQQI